MTRVRDRDRHAGTPARRTALACVEAGLEAALPDRAVADAISVDDGGVLRVHDHEYDLDAHDRLLILGGGKAGGGLAAALVDRLGAVDDGEIDDGAVVATDADDLDEGALAPVTVHEGDHPTPTARNVRATERVLDLAADADERTLVLAVVTGGASALLCAPAGDLTLLDLQVTTERLLESGAAIEEVNAVRRRFSAIKGGGLAAAAAPATVVTLAISDVVGDDPAVIGSGPTVPAQTSDADALAVLRRYDLRERVPEAVRDHLESGARERAGNADDSDDADATTTAPPAATDPDDWHLLATARTAIDAAVETAADRGYEPLVLSSRVRGEAREAGTLHAAVAEEIRESGEPVAPPAVVVSGGEVTTTVTGDGTGGPNQELALAAGIAFAREGTDAALASVDTDGIDGPTDAAGALVDRETVADPDAARAALADNDAGGYLDDCGALLETGYTGTNVNDLRVLVVERDRNELG